MPVKRPVRPTTKSDPQAMNSSWPKSSPTRYGGRNAAITEAPLKVESSPSTSSGLRNGFAQSRDLGGAIADCSAIFHDFYRESAAVARFLAVLCAGASLVRGGVPDRLAAALGRGD